MPFSKPPLQFGVFLAVSLALGACAVLPSKPEPPVLPSTAPSPAISPEARKILAQAEKDVQSAREQFALWTSAESALKQAWAAADINDSASVVRHALRASEQARAGLAQLAYPGTELK